MYRNKKEAQFLSVINEFLWMWLRRLAVVVHTDIDHCTVFWKKLLATEADILNESKDGLPFCVGLSKELLNYYILYMLSSRGNQNNVPFR